MGKSKNQRNSVNLPFPVSCLLSPVSCLNLLLDHNGDVAHAFADHVGAATAAR